MKKTMAILYAMVLVFGVVGIARATLWDRGGGLIYDDYLNITWLQDGNYAKTSGSDTDGLMNWYPATVWAENLEYYDTVRGITWSDWRLPKTVDGPYLQGYDGTTTGGYNITTSEMGHLYYVSLGNPGYKDTDGNIGGNYGLSNPGPFINLDRLMAFWSGTEYSLDPSRAWAFHLNTGDQDHGWKDSDIFSAWAVRDGDVAPIPEPATMLLLGSGLVGLAGFRKRFRKNN